MKPGLFFLAVLAVLLSASNLSETIGTPTWWDTSWHYRAGAEVNATLYSRQNWPIEINLNFTELMRSMGQAGTFDINSTRIVEHNSTGGVMYEVPSQFDTLEGYDAGSNAAGTVIFLLNGTTSQNAKRYFYIYFDKTENGEKNAPAYPFTLNYSWDGEEFGVNNSYIQWKADTARGENTSGLFDARGSGNTIFRTSSPTGRTKEYTQFQNGTERLMFDFRNNATFKSGPLRLTVTQRGSEAYWNDPDNKTGEGFMVKKYFFFGNASWIRVDMNFTNIAGYEISRSTTYGGGLSINELNSSEFLGSSYAAYVWGNSSNPASWYGASNSGSYGIGIVNENQSGTANYYAIHNSTEKRMGISLNGTAIPAGQSVLQRTAVHFNATNYNEPIIKTFRNNIQDPPEITMLSPEQLAFEVQASANYSQYNRGESALVFGNVTLDPYGWVFSVNATLDMATAGAGDDQTIILYDDGDAAVHGDASAGDKIFSNYFNLTASNATGAWNVTVRAYDSAGATINSSSSAFNLTDQYSTATSVENPMGISGRVVYAAINATNARNDTDIAGAELNCTYGAGPLTNITDYGNGTYRLNFTAPLITGTYYLNCTAAKMNNSGWDTDVFYTEAATTNMSVATLEAPYNASNITWYASENFTLTVNSTDTGNATARDTNITLFMPSVASPGTASGPCGDVAMGASCVKPFNITVLAAAPPGTYTLNITTSWKNPDTTVGESNSTFNITVLANPKIEVPEAIVSGTVGDGETREAGSFNVTSFGNSNASNITFSVFGLPFTVVFSPANISSIAPNSTNIVKVNVSVPAEYAPGTYNATLNASSPDGGWDNLTLQVIVPPNTTIASFAIPASYNASNITWYSSENFTLTVNSTNTGNITARYANMTLYLPPIASGPSFYACGNISVSSSCVKPFNITVLAAAPPGTYTLNITTSWKNPDTTVGASNSTFNITVLANPKIEVPEAIVSGTVGDGETREAGSFNVTSFGNSNASNITFSVSGLPSFTVIFTPVNISAIAPNATQLVLVNVSVPFNYLAGNYSGTINTSAKNDGWDTLVLNVSVPENRSWARLPPSCTSVEVADTGEVCNITINNTGNAPLNFTIAPSAANHSSLSETNFTLGYGAAKQVLVSYDVSGNQKGYYNTTYVIYANTTGTTPENASFDIFLFPYLEPLINNSASSLSFGQNNSVEIFANITDRSGIGINRTYANVTMPSGIIFASNMTLLNTSGNLTLWKATFPFNFTAANQSINNTPSTNERGIYNISIASIDNSAAIGYAYSVFSVHRNISVYLGTPFARYPEGDATPTVGEVNYTAIFFGGTHAAGANVTFGILSPDNFTWLMVPRQYAVYSDGKIHDVITGQAPTFNILPGHAGNYTMFSETSFYDELSNETAVLQKNATFEVYSRLLNIEIFNPVLGGTKIAFSVRVKDIFGAYITPDNMTLSLFQVVQVADGTTLDVLDRPSFNVTDPRVTRKNTSVGPEYNVGMSSLSTSSDVVYKVGVSANYGNRVGEESKVFNPSIRTWYDVLLKLREYEVYPGDFLDFDLYIENKMGQAQDVHIDYWVSPGGITDKLWDSSSADIFVNKSSNVTVPFQKYIFSTQPYGIYWLNVKVTAKNDSTAVPWQEYATFAVVQKPPTPPAIPPAPTGAAVSSPSAAPSEAKEKVKAVSIIKYPKNISTVRGWTDISGIEVKNTGTLPIANLTLSFTGVPRGWYTLRPNKTQGLAEGNTTVYLLEFRIPTDASPGTYDLVFTARADDVMDEKMSQLNIFPTVSGMLEAELRELKMRLQNLEAETRLAEAAGKNVTQVWPALLRAKEETSLAESALVNASYVDAENRILIAKNFLERAEFLLSSAEYIRIVPAKIIPWWLIALVIALAFIASFAMLWTFRLKHRMNAFFRSPALMERLVQGFRKEKEDRQLLLSEREKIVRMQNLLEKEVQDGTITAQAYEELKKRTLEKLAGIDKKLR